MLNIIIPAVEGFNEGTSEFFMYPEIPLELEHSLISLDRWESKWEIPFLNPRVEKTTEQTLDYIRCMATTEVTLEDLSRLTEANIKAINEYIDRKFTATTFNELPQKLKGDQTIVTAEIIYYWLVALTIPFETAEWHLNKLLALVKVVNIKNTPAKKGAAVNQESAAERRARNEANRKYYNTTG